MLSGINNFPNQIFLIFVKYKENLYEFQAMFLNFDINRFLC